VRSARFVCLFVILGSMILAAQSNPVPLINQPLMPASTTPGGQGFVLTVNGTGFVSGSVVNWNGDPRTTTFVNNSQLTAAIMTSDIATAGTASVTVSSPSPGGGISTQLERFFTAKIARIEAPASEDAGKPMAGKVHPFQPVE
jgi:hypothetical protein